MNSADSAIAARAFANIADMLSCLAYGYGGLRSGPSRNEEWLKAFEKLEVYFN